MKKPQLNYANLRLLTATLWATALMAFGVGQYFNLIEQHPWLITLTIVASIIGAATGLFSTVHRFRFRDASPEEPLAFTTSEAALVAMLASACLITLTQAMPAPLLWQQIAMAMTVVNMAIFAVTKILAELKQKPGESGDARPQDTC